MTDSHPEKAAPASVPELYRWLEPALGAVDANCLPYPTGPRYWWGGPLDAEGLALGSVQAALTSLKQLLGSRVRYGITSAGVAASFASISHLRIEGRAAEGFAPMSRYFPVVDGWVRTHANYPQHAAALEGALEASGAAEVARALERMTAGDAERRVSAAGGVAAALRTPSQWADSPMAPSQGQPWIDFELTHSARPLQLTEGNALSGLRVLDFTRVIAGPTGTRLLAALGADVLRIDPPHLPELLDQHLDTGFGKRSALADLRCSNTLARVANLIESADVVFTGYRPGALARLGLDTRTLRERYPHLSIVSLNAWGQEGPWASGRGFDSIVQSATGIGHLYGAQDKNGNWSPGALPVQALDHATGYGMAAAALSLLDRRRRGIGAGSAHLSLAATAQVLLGMPLALAPAKVMEVTTMSIRTPYGTIVHIPPPFTADGKPAAYPSGPQRYGSSALQWNSEEGPLPTSGVPKEKIDP